jgi:hypothetical protein
MADLKVDISFAFEGRRSLGKTAKFHLNNFNVLSLQAVVKENVWIILF